MDFLLILLLKNALEPTNAPMVKFKRDQDASTIAQEFLFFIKIAAFSNAQLDTKITDTMDVLQHQQVQSAPQENTNI